MCISVEFYGKYEGIDFKDLLIQDDPNFISSVPDVPRATKDSGVRVRTCTIGAVCTSRIFVSWASLRPTTVKVSRGRRGRCKCDKK
jgi:hypothetical protein